MRYLQPVEYHYISPNFDSNYPRISAFGTIGTVQTFARRYILSKCNPSPYTITDSKCK